MLRYSLCHCGPYTSKRYRLVGHRRVILSVPDRWVHKFIVVQVELGIRFVYFVIITVTVISSGVDFGLLFAVISSICFKNLRTFFMSPYKAS